MKSPDDKHLFREISIVLIIKIVLLFTIWYFYFDDTIEPVTTDDIANKFISEKRQGETL